MAYQDHMSTALQDNIKNDPIYWGAVAEIGRNAVHNNPNEFEHLFWQQPFRKDKAPSGPEYYAAIGVATMFLQGVPVNDRREHSGYGRVSIPTPSGCLADKEEQGNKHLLEVTLEQASDIHYAHYGRNIDFEVIINTTPPDDGRIVLSELECTRQFLRGNEMIAQDVLVTDVECILEIGYVATVHTMVWALLVNAMGVARFPYDAPVLMLAVPTGEQHLKEVLNERVIPKNLDVLSPSARQLAEAVIAPT